MEEKKPTSIRFPKSIKAWVKRQALKNDRSVSGEVIALMRRLKKDSEEREAEKPV